MPWWLLPAVLLLFLIWWYLPSRETLQKFAETLQREYGNHLSDDEDERGISSLHEESEVALSLPSKWDFTTITGPMRRERIVRQILETLFRTPFPSVRPEWLVNPQTGHRLEIDCFCEELLLAVEVSGSQHYREESHFHREREIFLKQLYRDRVKKEQILERGIDLIIVPYTIPIDRLPSYLLEKLRFLGY